MQNYTDKYLANFWAKVDRAGEDGCWPWTAATQRSRGGWLYGAVKAPDRSRRMVRAHRVSYEINVGPIPPGMQVDHRCRNTLCMNPRHLRVATQGQNQQNRAARRGSRSGIRGVCWSKNLNKWFVLATVDGVTHKGGWFTDLDEAGRAAVELRNRLMTHNDIDKNASAYVALG